MKHKTTSMLRQTQRLWWNGNDGIHCLPFLHLQPAPGHSRWELHKKWWQWLPRNNGSISSFRSADHQHQTSCGRHTTTHTCTNTSPLKERKKQFTFLYSIEYEDEIVNQSRVNLGVHANVLLGKKKRHFSSTCLWQLRQEQKTAGERKHLKDTLWL